MSRIVLEGLTKTFGDVGAVDRLDLEIADREFLTLLGPSGCGKSTTLNMIAGLDMPTGGRILFDDEEVTGLAPEDRDVAMVFQTYALYPHMKVYDNIAFALRLRGVQRHEIEARVVEAASAMEIGSLLERKPRQLSGGQQQRVALARAIVRQPRVFLLDEPLSNLDAKLRIAMRTELKRLHADLARTFVYVTHDQAEALMLSDRIAVLHEGRLQQVGDPEEIYRRPVNAFVADFVGSPPMNFFAGTLLEADGEGWSAQGEGWQCKGLGQIAGSPTKQVQVGVRPEDIEVDPEDGATARGVVLVREPVGSDVYLSMDLQGSPCKVRTRPQVLYKAGDTVPLRFTPDKLHVFDAASGRSLLQAC